VRNTKKIHALINNLFQLIILDIFRTNNCSSSVGVLYKHLTVFHRASYEESSGWRDTTDKLIFGTYGGAQIIEKDARISEAPSLSN